MPDDNPTGAAQSGPSETSPAGMPNPRQWLDLHGDYLFRYALIRVRNETIAEDLLQDTLLAAFKSRDLYSGGNSERGWLTGILRHKIFDHFRRLKREQMVSPSDKLPEELEGRFDDLGLWKREPALGPREWGEDAAALLQRKEFMAALKVCLDRLPPRCADAFVLREMEAENSDRIQEILGVSPSNFWVLMHRARMQLRLCLEENWLNPDQEKRCV